MTTPSKESIRKYYQKNREKLIAATRKWQLENPEMKKANHRKSHLKMKYGMTEKEFNSIFSEQDNKCAICLTVDPGKRYWSIDHNHTTTKVRGILCMRCNMLLGYAKDNINILNSAINYLITRP